LKEIYKGLKRSFISTNIGHDAGSCKPSGEARGSRLKTTACNATWWGLKETREFVSIGLQFAKSSSALHI
jgi:hypothetical protein